jgi:DNA-binding CsgD family transcriptional regulator
MVYAPNIQPPTARSDESVSAFSLLKVVLATLMDAVMVVSPDGLIRQSNPKARQLCDRINQTTPGPHHPDHLPSPIQPLFAALRESRDLFPEQRVLPEFELNLDDHTPLRIRGQFLDIPRADGDVPYVLITIENRQESLHSVAIGDAQRFGFTAREREIWYMRLLGHSYREISTILFITENTVRKHVKSILAKRRVEFDQLA